MSVQQGHYVQAGTLCVNKNILCNLGMYVHCATRYIQYVQTGTICATTYNMCNQVEYVQLGTLHTVHTGTTYRYNLSTQDQFQPRPNNSINDHLI